MRTFPIYSRSLEKRINLGKIDRTQLKSLQRGHGVPVDQIDQNIYCQLKNKESCFMLLHHVYSMITFTALTFNDILRFVTSAHNIDSNSPNGALIYLELIS